MDIPICTQLTFNRHLINSQSIVRRVLTDPEYYQLKIRWLLNKINCWPRCRWNVVWMSTDVSMECWSRVLIDTRLQMPLVNTWSKIFSWKLLPIKYCFIKRMDSIFNIDTYKYQSLLNRWHIYLVNYLKSQMNIILIKLWENGMQYNTYLPV